MHSNTITHSDRSKPTTPREIVKRKAPSLGRGIAIVMGILLTLSLFRNIQTFFEADQTIEKMSLRLIKLENEQKELQKLADEAGQDYFLEKQAREKLGLGKEGEISLVLPPQDVLRRLAPKSSQEEDTALPEPHWRRWVRLFF